MEGWLNWNEINEIIKDKKVAFFGRGNWVLKTNPYLNKEPHCIYDNNKFEWGETRELGLKVYPGDTANTAKDTFIIVTTSHFHEVYKQLIEMGLIPGEDFCISPALKNHRAQVEIAEHSAEIYLTCSDHSVKESDFGGGLYKFNTGDGTLTKLINGKCHGMVQAGEFYYLVNDTRGGILKLDSQFKTVEDYWLPSGCRPHGIGYCPRRNLVFVNLSDHDKIIAYDANSFDVDSEIQLSEKRWKMGTSQHHINDALVYEDSLYVTMFSFSGNWKIGIFDGGILEFDIDSGRQCPTPLVSNLWMPHTPTIIQGKLWYVDSMRGKAYCGTEELPIEFNGFIRGIAYDGRFYYIGQSLHRHPDRLRKISHNISLDTGVFLVDKDSYMTRFYPTPGLTDINTILIPAKSE